MAISASKAFRVSLISTLLAPSRSKVRISKDLALSITSKALGSSLITLKRLYEQEDYESALLIDNNDIIKYDFKLTDVNKLISGIRLEYEYDYGADSYLKKTNLLQIDVSEN